jgi:phosphoglycerate dehydrogenase-like enzyme
MKNKLKIAVTSASFSKTNELIHKLKLSFKSIIINKTGAPLNESETIDLLKDCSAAIIGTEKITSHVLDSCPHLKLISKYGVGLDNIDFDACKLKGVKVVWTSGVNKRSVSEMTLSFMIGLCRNMYTSHTRLSKGTWIKDGGSLLSNKIVGLIGIGHVGKDVISLLKPFGCRILVNDIIDQPDYYQTIGVEHVDKDTIFRMSDIISLHTPLTPKTHHLLSKSTFNKLKPSTYIINTARGNLIDFTALKKALSDKKIAGAALDVYDSEPHTDISLLNLDNVICTPHIGGNAKESVLAMGNAAISNLIESIE